MNSHHFLHFVDNHTFNFVDKLLTFKHLLVMEELEAVTALVISDFLMKNFLFYFLYYFYYCILFNFGLCGRWGLSISCFSHEGGFTGF